MRCHSLLLLWGEIWLCLGWSPWVLGSSRWAWGILCWEGVSGWVDSSGVQKVTFFPSFFLSSMVNAMMRVTVASLGDFKLEDYQSVQSCIGQEYLWAGFILEDIEVGGWRETWHWPYVEVQQWIGQEIDGGLLLCDIHVWDVDWRVPVWDCLI